MRTASGEKYDAKFVMDKPSGEVSAIRTDGRIERGVWQDGRFVGEGGQPSAGSRTATQSSSKFGFVTIAADDQLLDIFSDGAFVGNTPAKLKLAEGAHVIEVKKAGFKDYKKEIKVSEGSELTLRAVLEKN